MVFDLTTTKKTFLIWLALNMLLKVKNIIINLKSGTKYTSF